MLDNTNDVFFLTPPEALDLAAGGDVEQKRDLIQTHKEQHTLWKSQIAPDLVGDDGREVVNVKEATTHIRTGDWIQVDGTNGWIAVGDRVGGRRDVLCES